jgi:hypothetical protein
MGRPRRSQKFARRRQTLNAKDRMAARDVRAQWPSLDARVEASPETALCVSLLATGRGDLLRYAEAAKRLQRAKDAAKATLAWMFNDGEGVPFDWAARSVGREPNGLREAMLHGVDVNLVRMAMGGMNWVCPVCGGKH